MKILQLIAFAFIVLYFLGIIVLYLFQTRLIFYPGKLPDSFAFKLGETGEEVFIRTKDGEKINGLFFSGSREVVILYFHGNAGDLRGWQFAAEDFVDLGYNILVIDYRGYGKSTGSISEQGFYLDAEAAYDFLISKKGFNPQDVIIYGRSIGTGVAVELATKFPNKGLVLESAYTSLGELANSKVPFFFPSLYMRYSFDNISKINKLQGPLVVIHGVNDTLIPSSYGTTLYRKFEGRKKLILIEGGAHNDLSSFEDYHFFMMETLGEFFEEEQRR